MVWVSVGSYTDSRTSLLRALQAVLKVHAEHNPRAFAWFRACLS